MFFEEKARKLGKMRKFCENFLILLDCIEFYYYLCGQKV